ncbi:MAG: outer membrane protein assembly factor BamE [Holosporales bacterium]|jgi:outer membrane protein assembly factor BamE (lipoprotein component of BamABCDE complex)|nr:outer membrane protein assembly factor BamE [Holosporales bacterium]
MALELKRIARGWRRNITVVIMILCVSACEKITMNRGYVIEPAAFSKILVGKDDEQTVFEKLGSPTIRSSIIADDGSYNWYYVSKRTEKNGFLDPKVVDQKTVIVSFNKNGVVKAVSKGAEEQSIKTVSDKTETQGKNAGVWGEVFSGLGKYRKAYSDK